MKSLLTVAIVLACVLAACGDGSEAGSIAPEEAAQAAVAGFLTALADRDGAAACALLTSAAQDEIVGVFNRLDDPQPSWERCEDPLQELLDGVGAADHHKATRFAEQVSSGDLPNGSVSAAIAEDTGAVTIAVGDALRPVPVELYDGEWLIDSAETLLFGAAKG